MTSAEIASELRASRPVAGDTLRQRVRAIAATPPQRRQPFGARLRSRRLSLVLIPAAAGALALATAGAIGLERSGGNEVTLYTGDAPTVESTAQDAQAERESLAAPKLGGSPGAPTQAPSPTIGRAQRFTAQLSLEVEDAEALSAATQRALQVTQSLGGYVVSVTYATAENGTASMTLRVPTEKAQDAIVRLTSLGTIVAQNVQIDDLQETLDAQNRTIARLLEQIARLSARLADPDLDEGTRRVLQSRLDQARAELAAARAVRTQVKTEASLATISLTLQTPDASEAVPAPSRFDRALEEAAKVLAWEAAIVLYLAVTLAPFALIGLAFYAVRRTRRRHDTEQLLASS